jgi:glyoxylase-like metal-dependent hydrolase (beta-lactamase superfamily II)
MRKKYTFLIIFLVILYSFLSYSKDDQRKIEVTRIREGIYMFWVNEFVNMVAFTGSDGVLLVDSGLPRDVEKVKAILKSLGNSNIKYIINTHSDFDHIAGNRSLGENALVIAHENCRDQMLKYIEPDYDIPFDKEIFQEGLPKMTIRDQLTLHFNNEEIQITPLIGGHTDEDIITYFKDQGILCVGDMIFPDSFPGVKLDNGGSVQGTLKNIDTLLKNYSEDVLIISGHGRVMKVAELKEYRKMIVDTVKIVSNAVSAGKSVEQAKKEDVLKDWESWNSKMFPKDLNTDYWIETIVKSREIRLQKWIALSNKAYQSKKYTEYHRLMSQIVMLAPHDYKHRYNLACGSALIGNVQHSVKILQFLLDENYDLAVLAETDSDFKRIRSSESFQKLLRHIREKTQPLNNSQLAHSIPEKDLIPEGITYDPVDKAFYLGSVEKCKIIKIDRHGRVSDFTKPRQDGLVVVLGLRVDAKRRVLWAVSSYGFYKANLPRELLGTSGVFKFDLSSKKLLKKYMLPQQEGHSLNDLTLHPNGDVYVTDWRKSAAYYISASENTIEKFMDLPHRPNGIDLSQDGSKLFIAGTDIGVLDIATKTFKGLEHPKNVYLSGDGLYYYQNSLIAVQNGGLRKITRFYLNKNQDEIISSKALEAYHPLFNLPTTGVIIGEYFYYIANSQIREYDKEGRLLSLDKLEETKILKVKLQ